MDGMKGLSVIFWTAIAVLLTSCAGQQTLATIAAEPTFKALAPADIASASEPAVVTIYAYADDQVVATGTGFFIRNDGVFVSNMHVVLDAETLKIELADGEIFDDVYILGADDQRDLILLQVATSNTPSLSIADDRAMRIGDKVYALGNPLGLRGTFSDGILSGKRTEDGVSYLQITAPVSQGSSGGPVFNADGQVIGVATAYFEGGQNLNMAVPARHAMGLLAMAGEPRSFDVVMASIIAEEQEATRSAATGRAAETAELMAFMPANVQSSLASMSEYTRQATVRMLAFAALVEDNGYVYTDHSLVGALAPDGVDVEDVLLQRGEYLAVGSCDDDCVDLDLAIFDSSGDEVAADRSVDADSVVSFEVHRPAVFTLGVHMVDCVATDCVYFVKLFSR